MKKRIQVLIVFLLCMTVAAVAADKTVSPTSAAKSKKFTLVIDAGHGGSDAGAIGALTKEKTINLNVALAFGRLVERNCPDVKVIYTRKTDVFIPLHTRADIANRNKADLFISVHTNALPKGRISRGMETYTLGMHRAADNLAVAKRENEVILYETDYKQRYQGFDPRSSESYIMFEFMQDQNMAQSVELAKFVQKRTCASAGRQNKGVKQAGFLVLRETSMPSCLIELGFISTPDEERFLNSSEGVSLLGQGIYQAFLDYKRKHDGNIVVPLKAETKQEVTVPTVVPQDEVEEAKNKKKEKEKKKRSKMAQELADAREGKNVPDTIPSNAPVAPSVDSVVAATPSVASMPVAFAQIPAPAQPVTPVQPATPAPVAQQTPVQQTPVAQQTPVTQPATPVQPAPKAQQTPVQPAPAAPAPVSTPAVKKQAPVGAPVFKVQILACSTQLKPNDPQLKGVKNAYFYQEGGLYKYTVGASTDYNEIAQLRKTLVARFPQAFIIAFKNGQKVNVQAAIQEFKANK